MVLLKSRIYNTYYNFKKQTKNMDDYTILGRIGEGAHGIVMKGRHRKSGTIVALKKVLLKRLEDGLPETALREIKALQVLIIFDYIYLKIRYSIILKSVIIYI